jgi:hypothetical protein
VLFVALAMAGLRIGNAAWDRGTLGLALALLLTAVLLAVHREGSTRAFWLGFALFGWAYLGASLIPAVESRLPTTSGLVALRSLVVEDEPTVQVVGPAPLIQVLSAGAPPQIPPVVLSPGTELAPSGANLSYTWAFAGNGVMTTGVVARPEFIPIGHSQLALIVAFLGGHLSRFLYRRDPGRLRQSLGEGVPGDAASVNDSPTASGG